MAILIDPPRWPAHGTVFSHLISDDSLDELHSFASLAGLPGRAFDLDHYDVPQRRYADLVALGAEEVTGRELVRRLSACGLRIPARQRNARLEAALLTHWRTLLCGQDDLGRELSARWGEGHRRYHDRTHLLAVLDAVDFLHGSEPLNANQVRIVKLAAWFHDAVYRGRSGTDEEESAMLAETRLPAAGCSHHETVEVARLVRVTAHHRPPAEDVAAAILCDADLSVLGAAPADYDAYVRAVRVEYSHLSDAEFAAGRTAVIRGLLAHRPLFHTKTGLRTWEPQARNNLARELDARLARNFH